MQKWLLVSAALVLLVAGIALVWPRAAAPPAAEAPAQHSPPPRTRFDAATVHGAARSAERRVGTEW